MDVEVYQSLSKKGSKIASKALDESRKPGQLNTLGSFSQSLALRAPLCHELGLGKGITPGLIRGSIQVIREQLLFNSLDHLEKVFLKNIFQIEGIGVEFRNRLARLAVSVPTYAKKTKKSRVK